MAEHALRVEGHVRRQPEHQHTDDEGARVGRVQHPAPEDPQRQHRLGACATRPARRWRAARPRRRRSRCPWPSPTPSAPRPRAGRAGAGTRRLPAAPRRGSRWSACGARHARRTAPQHPAGRDAQRQVDEEDPAPGQVVGEDAAQCRPDERGHGPDAGDVALHLGALGQGVDVADDRHAHRLHRARAEALDEPEDDEAGMLQAMPHSSDPRTKSPMPSSITGLRP